MAADVAEAFNDEVIELLAVMLPNGERLSVPPARVNNEPRTQTCKPCVAHWMQFLLRWVAWALTQGRSSRYAPSIICNADNAVSAACVLYFISFSLCLEFSVTVSAHVFLYIHPRLNFGSYIVVDGAPLENSVHIHNLQIRPSHERHDQITAYCRPWGQAECT